MAYTHTNSKGKKYYLHSKVIVRPSGKNTTLYYFSGTLTPELALDAVPAGKTVVEMKSGLPVLKNV
ncbi:hypothetical protein ACFLXB_07885 [Chloroflexota bacterium]